MTAGIRDPHQIKTEVYSMVERAVREVNGLLPPEPWSPEDKRTVVQICNKAIKHTLQNELFNGKEVFYELDTIFWVTYADVADQALHLYFLRN